MLLLRVIMSGWKWGQTKTRKLGKRGEGIVLKRVGNNDGHGLAIYGILLLDMYPWLCCF